MGSFPHLTNAVRFIEQLGVLAFVQDFHRFPQFPGQKSCGSHGCAFALGRDGGSVSIQYAQAAGQAPRRIEPRKRRCFQGYALGFDTFHSSQFSPM
jgi:hypothetical protein